VLRSGCRRSPCLANATRRSSAALPQLDLLINNAGIAAAGETELFTMTTGTRFFKLMVGRSVRLPRVYPWLKQNPSGAHILNISSLDAFTAVLDWRLLRVEGAVLSFSETLYGELRRLTSA